MAEFQLIKSCIIFNDYSTINEPSRLGYTMSVIICILYLDFTMVLELVNRSAVIPILNILVCIDISYLEENNLKYYLEIQRLQYSSLFSVLKM